MFTVFLLLLHGLGAVPRAHPSGGHMWDVCLPKACLQLARQLPACANRPQTPGRLHGTHVRAPAHLPACWVEAEPTKPKPVPNHPRLQGYKAQLTQMGQWQAAMASLNPAVQQKLAAMCQL